MNTLGAKLVDFYECGLFSNGSFTGGKIVLNLMGIDTCHFTDVDLSKVTNCEFLQCNFVRCAFPADQMRRNRFVICTFFDMNIGAVETMEGCHIR